ncbi:uncharacterized protein Z519_00134 [Cladophialophora bantiana CBS 173.52]|uniref:C2H2-type domain-containing protein n=1 Tax=Cladophialophora bantiana (strain ATCC 10958 / CBS 173.52 / CDC B-1940 / NIH 8579) TaxID=1442370 RepID=A0A0D2HYI1_CLAB1|nr:uncharacterized protein Z519_00134 [Cladophialophora bantiana CBS 173.52]KIW98473.1 hypothetical protein Z519_00134 [Cladophialophora bantiana CBS 173.52]
MANENRNQHLTCPFCRFDCNDFDSLEKHVQHLHTDRQPDPRQPYSATSQLSDAELAQLLAFEEAGLPAELALPDRRNVPACGETQTPESATDLEQSPSSSQGGNEESWVLCVCGERVHFLELDAHSDMHAQENITLDEIDIPSGDVELATTAEPPLADLSNSFSTRIPKSLRNYDQIHDRTPRSEKRRGPSLKDIFLGTHASPKRESAISAVSAKVGKTKRLGRSELGPYAHEHQMPSWLRRMLEKGAKVTITNRIGPDGTLVKVETIANETPNLVPVLSWLSHLDRTVERAFYCSPKVVHVCKMPREGGFCGYRNIQMLLSYLHNTDANGAEKFPGRLPSILKLQDMIENAWDRGFNSVGRAETGGIRFTRKFIGTPEAQALFMSLDIPCEATAYATTKEVEGFETMLCAVCEYFDDDVTKDNINKVVITAKPPIYFQHRGHSMTIVGVEQRLNGVVNLVVFDPMFNPSPALKKLALSRSTAFGCARPGKFLNAHRRDEKYLYKFKDFELLKLRTKSP